MHLIQLPGPWVIYQAGRLVKCPGIMERRGAPRDATDRRAYDRRCDQWIIRVGQDREIHIRVIALQLDKDAPLVENHTRHCHWCKNVTEFKEVHAARSA